MSNKIESLDSSLWWDPFVSLLAELENAPLTLELPAHLVKKLRANQTWFLETLNSFKSPNDKSRNALNSEKLVIGMHELDVRPEVREKALRMSSYLCLDEVQSYIVVDRFLQSNGSGFDSITNDDLHLVLIHYYIERQCLLKCVRHILLHTLYITGSKADAVKDEVLKMISNGMENKLISILEDLLSSRPPEIMDVDLFTMWAEETLAEDNLILDILFLIYYDCFGTVSGETWKKLCSLYQGMLCGTYNLETLEASPEASKLSYHAKLQCLFILIEGLSLENLLQMVHDAVPYRKNLIFSIDDIQRIDAFVSSFDIFEMKGASPLIFAWAVFLCLLSSLPGSEEYDLIMGIDHASYVRQASEGASFDIFLLILDSDLLNQSDGLALGYRSVLRTLLSAFIASYDVDLQSEDYTIELIINVICKVYNGQELLCAQFWDRESIIDGPIRSLLFSLEIEFPIRFSPLVRLLSSLCEGSWPSLCVHNFLEKSVGISTIFDVSDVPMINNALEMVETQDSLKVSGFENLCIPSKTCGRIHKFIGGTTALVRWEYAQSGVAILLLRLSQYPYIDRKEGAHILDLLARMVSFNMAVAFKLMEIDKTLNFDLTIADGMQDKRYWVLDIICSIIRNLHPSPESSAILSLAVFTLSKLMRCAPSYTASISLRIDIFEMAAKTASDTAFNAMRGSWMVSGNLEKMLVIDSEENSSKFPLTISVLEFIIQLLETKLEDDFVQAFIIFVLQYVCVNHDSWRYKCKCTRWRVTHKVLEVMKKGLLSIPFYGKFGATIRDMLLLDSSINNIIFRLICVDRETLERLYVSRHIDLVEIEGLQKAILSALNVLDLMVPAFYKDISTSIPLFYQVLLSTTTKPVPVTSAIISFVSYFPHHELQSCAAQVLSKLFMLAEHLSSHAHGNVCIAVDSVKVASLRYCISKVLDGIEFSENLSGSVLDMLGSAARHQPAFLLALLYPEKSTLHSVDSGEKFKSLSDQSLVGLPEPSLLDAIVLYLKKANDFNASNPKSLFLVLEFLRAVWQGAAHYAHVLEYLKGPGKIWNRLSECVSVFVNFKVPSQEDIHEKGAQDYVYKYQSLSSILEILACEAFLSKKLVLAELIVDHNSTINGKSKLANNEVKQILLMWSEEPVLRNIIDLCANVQYDYKIHYRVKVARSLLVVRIMENLVKSKTGSLSLPLVQSIQAIFDAIRTQNVFSELMEQYSQRGYSSGNKLISLILNDLFYLIQGELEGRKIGPGPFKDLFQFLLESNCFQAYKIRDRECSVAFDGLFLYDLEQIRSDTALDTWQYTEWREFKGFANNLLDCMQKENSAFLVAQSKLLALKALTYVVVTCEDESMKEKIQEWSFILTHLLTCVDNLFQCFHKLLTTHDPVQDFSEEIIDFVTGELELMFLLLRLIRRSFPVSITLPLLKMSVTGLKVLLEVSGRKVTEAKKLLLSLILLTLEPLKISNKEQNDLADISTACLSLLPSLIKCIAVDDLYMLSLATTNLMLACFLQPSIWLPLICKHLHWQSIVKKLEDQKPLSTIQTTLKFLLTLSSLNEGAEKLYDVGVFQSLRVSLANEKIWMLGLACITSLVHSLGDNFISCDVLDNLVSYMFWQNKDVFSNHLTIPELQTANLYKKRTRSDRVPISLNALADMEQTLIFVCAMSKHRSYWSKSVKEMNVRMREKIIHLLAFISRGNNQSGEFSKTAPFLCVPDVNGGLESYEKPSFVNSRNGWFAHSPFFCQVGKRVSSNGALVTKATSSASSATCLPTCFSDMVAVQIYRIAFLLLKFIAVEAESAAKRSMEVGFVDFVHVPELPMPEILHGLQDQAFVIVTELCSTHKSMESGSEIQAICLLLIQIMEMALYLEFCVIQICGIRPVLGRLEDFSKQITLLCKAVEGHSFLVSSMMSLKQIMFLVHPSLPNTEVFL